MYLWPAWGGLLCLPEISPSCSEKISGIQFREYHTVSAQSHRLKIIILDSFCQSESDNDLRSVSYSKISIIAVTNLPASAREIWMILRGYHHGRQAGCDLPRIEEPNYKSSWQRRSISLSLAMFSCPLPASSRFLSSHLASFRFVRCSSARFHAFFHPFFSNFSINRTLYQACKFGPSWSFVWVRKFQPPTEYFSYWKNSHLWLENHISVGETVVIFSIFGSFLEFRERERERERERTLVYRNI